MTTEWIELPDLQAVAIAQSKDWEIEVDTGPHWEEWKGAAWMNYMNYRGRPRQPKMRTVKMQCWIDDSGELRWVREWWSPNHDWIRVPAEDKTIEIPENV